MIHHYINLVCWREMLRMHDTARDIVWVDSISTHKLVARHNARATYRPGTTVLSQIGPRSSDKRKWFFLTAGPVLGISAQDQMELPFYRDGNIHVPEDVAARLKLLPSGSRVGIGISAPKQNWLAMKLHALRPDLEYHCLGAALAEDLTGSAQQVAWSASGFEWLRFLIVSPRRTWRKITTTLREFSAILLHMPSREAFRRFSELCATESAEAASFHEHAE